MLDDFDDFSTPLSEWVSKCSNCNKDIFSHRTNKYFFCSPTCKENSAALAEQQAARVATFLSRKGIDAKKYKNAPLPTERLKTNDDDSME